MSLLYPRIHALNIRLISSSLLFLSGGMKGVGVITAQHDLSRAAQCLEVDNAFEYPADAEDHFLSIHDRSLLRAFALNDLFPGSPAFSPYYDVEGLWLHDLCFGILTNVSKLRPTFGPFIPLCFPWSSFKAMGQLATAAEFVFAHIRPNVLYITVVWHDRGLDDYTVPNLMVMSMGGFGHVALPELRFPWPANQVNTTLGKPFHERQYLASFMGSADKNTYFHSFRRSMCGVMRNMSVRKAFKFIGCETSGQWIDIAKDSQVVLCPRGEGRNTLRLGEMMHMGLLPVVVYDDVPFVPYPTIFPEIGWMARIDELPQLIDVLQSMSESDFAARRDRVLQLRSSHFDKDGVVRQVRLFLHGKGDLKCRKLPPDPQSSKNKFLVSQRRSSQFVRASHTLLYLSRFSHVGHRADLGKAA